MVLISNVNQLARMFVLICCRKCKRIGDNNVGEATFGTVLTPTWWQIKSGNN